MTSSTSVNQFFMQLNAFTVSTIINRTEVKIAGKTAVL